MSLTNRILYGIHSITPINLTTGEFYGTAKIVGEASLEQSGEINELFGGASRNSWANEDGVIKSDVSVKIKEYPDWFWAIFAGKAITSSGADTTGTVSTLTNKYGTSAKSATTGITTVTVKAANKDDLKFTRYLVKVVSPTTVDVYAGSDVDFARGTDLDFVNDLLKITTTPLTITASAPVTIPSAGLELNGGSGTIGMTIGDTATFEVKPPSTDSMEVTVGGANDVYPEVGLLIVGQQRGNGEMVEIEVFACKGIGMPLHFGEKKFGEADIKIKARYDSTRNGVYKLRHIRKS